MPTQVPTEIIHIEWEGPLSLEDVAKLNGSTDYGVYQIYGGHVVYGSDALVYIGKAGRQSFGTRIKQETDWPENHDADRIRVYVGRLHGEATPSNETRERQIDLAERLLIYACQPAFNSKKSLGLLDPDLHNVHVLNWGRICDLLPEVSGARWSSKYDQIDPYEAYSE
ncbi:MAG TPA: hypothetical protein VMR52_02465 [Dehalococcoidia bacterium]|nr:hypothetical protein [Dehalococcoidia bacterium]